MASTKLVFLVVAVLLLQTSWCAVAQQASDAEPPAVMTLTSFEDGDPAAVMTLTSFEDGDPVADLAVMTLTSFEDGDPAACDGKYHNNEDLLMALPTKVFGSGRRCYRKIVISLSDGRNVAAVVVDECGGCKDNMIATSKRVWDDLGLDTNLGEVNVFYSAVQ